MDLVGVTSSEEGGLATKEWGSPDPGYSKRPCLSSSSRVTVSLGKPLTRMT